MTGWTIKWLELHDSAKAIIALDAGEANMVVANSADVAVALSRRLKVEIVWMMQVRCQTMSQTLTMSLSLPDTVCVGSR